MPGTSKQLPKDNEDEDIPVSDGLEDVEGLDKIDLGDIPCDSHSVDVRRRIDDLLERKKLREEFGEIDDFDF